MEMHCICLFKRLWGVNLSKKSYLNVRFIHRGRKVIKQSRSVEANDLSLNYINNVHHQRVGDTNFTLSYR